MSKLCPLTPEITLVQTQKQALGKAASLERFLAAQREGYAIALAEIKAGCKQSHWMWFIFPQLRGLGRSDIAHFYGIEDLEEAIDFLAHPLLGARLRAICRELLRLTGHSACEIFGSLDAIKLRSSMTLFALADSEHPSLFQEMLDAFFGGKSDPATLKLLGIKRQ